MPQDISMTNAEYRLSDIIWKNEPILSPVLCQLCEKQLGWKRTTTYTVLKKLCERNLMQNKAARVTSLIKRDQVLQHDSRTIVENRFTDGLPQFIAAFLNNRRLSTDEAEQLKTLIDRHKAD